MDQVHSATRLGGRSEASAKPRLSPGSARITLFPGVGANQRGSGSIATTVDQCAMPVTAPPAPFIVHIDQVPPVRLETGGKSRWDTITPIVAPIFSGLIAFGGVWLGLKFGEKNTEKIIDAARRSSEAAINQKTNEAEQDAIQEKLNSFFGPYLERSEENRLLALELRDRQPDKATFRTLLKLVDPAWFSNLSNTDQTIVDQIVVNGMELRTYTGEVGCGRPGCSSLPVAGRSAFHNAEARAGWCFRQ